MTLYKTSLVAMSYFEYENIVHGAYYQGDSYMNTLESGVELHGCSWVCQLR